MDILKCVINLNAYHILMLYFNCQQLNLFWGVFFSFPFTEFHLAHTKHLIAIGQHLSFVYSRLYFKSGYSL